MCWHPDGTRLAVAAGFRVALWEADGDRPPRLLEGSQSVVDRVLFNHRGDVLVSTGWDSRVRLWDASTGSPLVNDRPGNGCLLGFSPDDRLLACTRDGHQVAVWEVGGGQECRLIHDRPPAEGQGAFCVDFHPSGRLIASVSDDGARLYDTTAGRELTRLTTEPGRAVFFLPDGSLLARTPEGLRRWPVTEDAASPGGASALARPPWSGRRPSPRGSRRRPTCPRTARAWP